MLKQFVIWYSLQNIFNPIISELLVSYHFYIIFKKFSITFEGLK